MKLSISELIQMKSVIHSELNRVKGELQKGAFKKSLADDVLEEITLEEFKANLNKMADLQEDLVSIGSLVAKLNLETMIEVDGTETSIREGLEFAKMARNNANLYRNLGQKQKLIVDSGGRFSQNVENTRTEYLHDIEFFKNQETASLRFADRISRAVERASVVTEVEIDDKFEEYR